MNTIFKYQKIITSGPNGTTLQFKDMGIGIEPKSLELGQLDSWHYISIPDASQVPEQHSEINFQLANLTEQEKAELVSTSRAVYLINQEVVDSIRKKYSVDDELKLLRTQPSKEFDEYNAYVEACRAVAKLKKQNLGL